MTQQSVLNLQLVEQPPFVLADLFDTLSDSANPYPVSEASLELVKEYTIQEFNQLGLPLLSTQTAAHYQDLFSQKLRNLSSIRGKLIIATLDSEAKLPLIIESLRVLNQSNINNARFFSTAINTLLSSKTLYFLQWAHQRSLSLPRLIRGKDSSKSRGLRQFLADLFGWKQGFVTSQQFADRLNWRVAKTQLRTISSIIKDGQAENIFNEKEKSKQIKKDFKIPSSDNFLYRQYQKTKSIPQDSPILAYRLLTSLIMAPTEKIINLNQKMLTANFGSLKFIIS